MIIFSSFVYRIQRVISYTYSPGGERVNSSFGQQQLDDILSRIHSRYMQHIVVILGMEEDSQITVILQLYA